MKALVAIDGSENALRALRYLLDPPDFFSASAELVLANVHLPLPSPRARAVLRGSDDDAHPLAPSVLNQPLRSMYGRYRIPLSTFG